MPDPLSLKSVAAMVCMRVLLLENPPKGSVENTNVAMETRTEIRPYLTRLLQTDCFTAVSEEILYRILKFCPNQLTDDLLHALTPVYVEYLNLTDCRNVNITGLVKTLQKCWHLKNINLSRCSQLMCADIFTFIGLTKVPLTTVIMEQNVNVNDDVVHEMLRNLPCLHTLNISSCENVSDKVFLLDDDRQLNREFSCMAVKDEEYSCNLTSVDVSGCSELSSGAVRHLTSLCGPKLTDVNIAGTNINCIALLHLAGYSINAILDFADDSGKSDDECSKVFQELNELLNFYNPSMSGLNHKNTSEDDTVSDVDELKDSEGNKHVEVTNCEDVMRNNFVAEDILLDEKEDIRDTGTESDVDNVLDGTEIEIKGGTEQETISSESNDSGDLIPETSGQDANEAVVGDIIESFDRKTGLGACGDEVCETLDIENGDKHIKPLKKSKSPVETVTCDKNVQVSKETDSGEFRFEGENKILDNIEKDMEEEAEENTSLEIRMDTKVKVHQETSSSPVRSDKLKFCMLLYKPKIVKLNITRIKFVSKEHYLGQLCLEKFLAVNEGLQKFAVSWKGLTFDFFKKIVPRLSELIEVELEDCSMLTSAGVKALGLNCRKCKSVNLRGVVFIYDSGLLPFLENKNIQVLSLAESDQITDDILEKFSDHLNTSLTNLDLSYCEEISEKGINAICSKCTELKRLQLHKCQVSDFSLRLLSKTAPGLVEISLENAKISDEDSLTDDGILTIANTFRYLKVLNISWNLEITDVSVSAVMMNCNHLEEAIMIGLKRITIQPFLPIIADFEVGKSCKDSRRSLVYAPNLRVLDLYYNDLVDDSLLQQIVNVCRGTLEVTDYYGQILEPENV